MKKIKKLPILLALLMVLCIVPAVESKADTKLKVIWNGFTITYPEFRTNDDNRTSYDNTNMICYAPAYTSTGKMHIELTTAYYFKIRIQIYNSKNASVYDKTIKTKSSYDKIEGTDKIESVSRWSAGMDFNYPCLAPGQYRVVVTLQKSDFGSFTKANYTQEVSSFTLRTYTTGVYDYTKNLANKFGSSMDYHYAAYQLSTKQTYLRAVANNAYSTSKVKNYNSNQNDGFVTNMYYGLLGRQSDSAGREYWNNQLKLGAMTKAQVYNGFLNSPECIQKAQSLGINW